MALRCAAWLFLLAVGACGTEPACTYPPRPFIAAVTITVRDSLSGALAAAGTSAFARDSVTGAWQLVAQIPESSNADNSPIWVGQEPGTYFVKITKSGYADWFSGRVDVVEGDGDRCWHPPKTVFITARLLRAASP